MKRYRFLALILAVLLTAAMFAGCSGSGNEETTVPSDTSASETTVATTEGKPDLGGYELKIVSPWVTEWQPVAGTALGTVLQAEYDKIQEDYNFSLKLNSMDESLDIIMSQILSGTYANDVYDLKIYMTIPLGMNGYIVDWTSQTMKDLGIDVNDSELFNQYLSKLSIVGDAQYGLQVASQYYLPQFGYGILFNKNLLESKGYKADDLYQSVRDGKWNFSAYLDLASKISEDTNGDGTVDVYSAGGGSNPYGAEVYLAGGAPVIYRDGKWVYTLDEANGIKGLDFMREVFFDSGSRFTGGAGTSREMFRDGTCAMLWAAGFYLSNDVIQQCAFDYGLLPMPKSDDLSNYVDVLEDPRHLTMMTGNVNETAVKAFKLWCGVMNNEQSWQKYMLDESLRGDEQAFEMVTKYIMPNSVLNTSALNKDEKDIFDNEVYEKVRTGEMTPAQAVQAQKQVIQAIFDELFNQ